MPGQMKECVLVCDISRDEAVSTRRDREVTKRILTGTKKLCDWARATGRPVIYVGGLRRRTDKFFLERWPHASLQGGTGFLPAEEIGINADTDIVILKPRYSSLYESGLEVTLKELGVQHLILCGWSTSVAILTTAIDAYQRLYTTTVLSDLTDAGAWGGQSAEEAQKWSLEYIKTFACSEIVTSEELMRRDQGPSEPRRKGDQAAT